MSGYRIQSKKTAQTLSEVGSINFSGNIIPNSWFQHLRYREGKYKNQPFSEAIIVLSEIVWWYRPIEIRDERTGATIGYRQKFKAELLQRSIKSLARKFGFTYKKTSEAITFLESEGIIHKRLAERLELDSGDVLGNVLFIGLNVTRLREITTPYTDSAQGYSRLGLSLMLNEDYPYDDTEGAYTETTNKDYEQRGGGVEESSTNGASPSASRSFYPPVETPVERSLLEICGASATSFEDRTAWLEVRVTLQEAGATVDDVRQFEQRFRNQFKSRPCLSQVATEWPRLMKQKAVLR